MEGLNIEQVEKEIFEWLNKARTQPKTLVPFLKERYQTFRDKAWKKGDKWYNSKEGDVAVKEAFEFLEEHEPLKPLTTNGAILKAAKEHSEDMQKNGITGHTGSNGSTMAQRVEKNGKWKGGLSENVAFQQFSGLDFILYWIVDDGMASRADRKNIFNKAFGVCGISVSAHPKFKSCAVLVLSGEIDESQKGKEATRLLNEHEKAGHDQLGVNDLVFNYGDMQKTLEMDMAGDLKKKWIPGAVSMSTEKSIVKDGGKEKTVFKFIYTMGDGSKREVVEDFNEIVPNK